jgi:chorismate synthase
VSSIGTLFRVTLFGESHGPVAGALVTGCPAGVPFDQAFVQHQLDRRRPGQSLVTTQRKEADQLEVLAGVFQGRTTGAPLCLLVRNGDTDSSVYPADRPRPGHADLGARYKFFGFEDPRGAGHFGGRLTVGLVAAGAVARLALARAGVELLAYADEIGGIQLEREVTWTDAARAVDSNAVRCPEAATATQMEQLILATRKQGDSVGGVVRCRIKGMAAGLGSYHFESFESQMGQLLFGIPAVKGVEFGLGFSLARARGSETNDEIGLVEGKPRTLTRKQGGVVGGMTDGNEVDFRVAFKPTSSLPRPQRTVDLATMEPVELVTRGRHDPCIVPRAVPVVENAAAVVVLDLLLRRLGEEGFQALNR